MKFFVEKKKEEIYDFKRRRKVYMLNPKLCGYKQTIELK
jgi:hypothetical protein